VKLIVPAISTRLADSQMVRTGRQIRPAHVAQNLGVLTAMTAAGFGLYMLRPSLNMPPIGWLLERMGVPLSLGIDGWLSTTWKAVFIVIALAAIPGCIGYAQRSEKNERARVFPYGRTWRYATPGILLNNLVVFIILPPYASIPALALQYWYSYHFLKGGIARSAVYRASMESMLMLASIALIAT